MVKKMKQYLAMALSAVMLFTVLPVDVLASEPAKTPPKIAYNTNGGTYIPASTVMLLPEENPEKTGYVFVEWQDADGTAVDPAEYIGEPVPYDMEIYAKWKPEEYEVTVPTILSATVENGKTINIEDVEVNYNTEGLNDKASISVTVTPVTELVNNVKASITNSASNASIAGGINSAGVAAGDQTATFNYTSDAKYKGNHLNYIIRCNNRNWSLFWSNSWWYFC